MKLCKIIVPISFILILSFVIYGRLFGFPSEKKIISGEVDRYVRTEYGLTPTNIEVSFSIDGMNSAFVSVKEYPFSIRVYVNRETKKCWGDLYLESLVEYRLEMLVYEKVSSFVDPNNIIIGLERRFTKGKTKLNADEINANPNILLNNPEVVYYCMITRIEKDFEKSYKIFNQITKFFTPTSIDFHYAESKGEKVHLTVKRRDFDKIHNKNDFIFIAKKRLYK